MCRFAPTMLLGVLMILAGMVSHGAKMPAEAMASAVVESCAMDGPSPCGCMPPTEAGPSRGCCCVVEEPDRDDQPLPPAVRLIDVRPIVFVANARPRVELFPFDSLRLRLVESRETERHTSNRRQHFRASIGVWVT